MKKTSAVLALCLFALAGYSLRAAVNGYLVRNLVSDIPNLADHTDPNLVGAWGISESAASPFWIADAGTSQRHADGSGQAVAGERKETEERRCLFHK